MKNKKNVSKVTEVGNFGSDLLVPVFEHVLLSVFLCAAIPTAVASALDLNADDTQLLVQTAFLMSAVASLIQIVPLRSSIKRLDVKLPITLGVSLLYLPILESIGVEYDSISVILGSQLIASVIIVFFGWIFEWIIPFVPASIPATICFLFGVFFLQKSIYFINMDPTPKFLGIGVNWILAIIMMGFTLSTLVREKGWKKSRAFLRGLGICLLIALFSGLLDYESAVNSVVNADWYFIPRLMPFKFEFQSTPIIAYTIVTIVLNMAFSMLGIVGMPNKRLIYEREDLKSITDSIFSSCNFSSLIAAFFGGFGIGIQEPNYAFSSFGRQSDAVIVAGTSFVMLLCGLCPKIGEVFMIVPSCIMGGIILLLALGTILVGLSYYFVDSYEDEDKLDNRLIIFYEVPNRKVFVISLILGYAISWYLTRNPGVMDYIPRSLGMVLSSTPIVTIIILFAILEIIFPAHPPKPVETYYYGDDKDFDDEDFDDDDEYEEFDDDDDDEDDKSLFFGDDDDE